MLPTFPEHGHLPATARIGEPPSSRTCVPPRSPKFILDILGCFPYDKIAVAIATSAGGSQQLIISLRWLGVLSLVSLWAMSPATQIAACATELRC